MEELKNKRLNIRLSEKLVKEIDEYQYKQSIPHRNTAIAELIRKGLNQEEEK